MDDSFVKRAMDIVGSSMALVVLSPLFILISLAIKLDSQGPVLFKQERVGQYGRRFTFLRFRSMRSNSDPNVLQGRVDYNDFDIVMGGARIRF